MTLLRQKRLQVLFFRFGFGFRFRFRFRFRIPAFPYASFQSSLRTADSFPVVASLPPKNSRALSKTIYISTTQASAVPLKRQKNKLDIHQQIIRLLYEEWRLLKRQAQLYLVS